MLNRRIERRPEARNAARLKTLEALAATRMSGQQRSLLTVAPDARDSYCGSILSCAHFACL